MRRNVFVFVLTATGSALCWWPVIMEPGLDSIPFWLPLVFVALITGLSTILSGGRWLLSFALSVLASFAGMCAGFAIWWPTDGIAASYTPIVIVVGTFAVALISLAASLAVRRLRVSNAVPRGASWLALVCCVVLGPMVVAVTPPLVLARVTRNDRLAAERFGALRVAVEQTNTEPGGAARICDGKTLKQHYSGPHFSDIDWRYIAGNYVQKDGYSFGIYIYCPQPEPYVIDAQPVREKGDGTRHFCADASGRVGCGMGTHEECLPCTR